MSGWSCWSRGTPDCTHPCITSWAICPFATFAILLLSLPRCWLISYLSKKGFHMMYVPSRCTFLEPLEMWNVSCWLSWLMIVMGHLQSTSLYNCHVQGNLYPACGYCLHRRLGWFSNPYLLYISVVILQFQYHQSLFLWHPTLISPLLLRYNHQWDCDVHFYWLCCGDQHYHCPPLLQLYHNNHP